jgi:hypothetical protein
MDATERMTVPCEARANGYNSSPTRAAEHYVLAADSLERAERRAEFARNWAALQRLLKALEQ